jgi:hypothetical protein
LYFALSLKSTMTIENKKPNKTPINREIVEDNLFSNEKFMAFSNIEL